MKYFFIGLLTFGVSIHAYSVNEKTQSTATRIKEEAMRLRQVSLKKYEKFIDQTLKLLGPIEEKNEDSQEH